MASAIIDILILLCLLVINGIFAMSELSVLSSKFSKISQLAEEGDQRAKRVLKLIEHPNDFLAIVQVGITLNGIIAGAYGGGQLSVHLIPLFESLSLSHDAAAVISLGVTIAGITYLSLVIGELVPKRIAINNPEGLAMRVARPMQMLSRLLRPVVWLLSTSTRTISNLLGLRSHQAAKVTEAEIKFLVEQGAKSGILQEEEHKMVESIFRFGDRMVGSIMTPRSEVSWVDINDPVETVRYKILESSRSRFPVGDGSMQEVIGIVRAKDWLARAMKGGEFDIRDVVQSAHFVPENLPAIQCLDAFRTSETHLALVVDEYGDVVGLVTLYDVLVAIVGEVPSQDNPEDNLDAVERADGSWLVDGLMSIEKFRDRFNLKEILEEESLTYQTVAGLVMAETGDIPSVGDVVALLGVTIEVMDMDERRVDKVLVRVEKSEHKA